MVLKRPQNLCHVELTQLRGMEIQLRILKFNIFNIFIFKIPIYVITK